MTTLRNTPSSGLDWHRLLISVGISLGLLLVFFGFRSGLTGRDQTDMPKVIERISPANGDRILRQSQIIVDFVEGYEAVLMIDSVEIPTTRLDELKSSGQTPQPGAQVELPPTAVFDPGNFVISFQPQNGAIIESFAQGTHTGQVKYWKVDDGRENSMSYTWQFDTD